MSDLAGSNCRVTVERVLRNDIAAGRYPAESRLPAEQALCQRYSASRFAVRAALRRLGEDKVVRPVLEQGLWAVVRQPDTPSSDVWTIDGVATLASGYQLDIDSVDLITIDAELEDWTGLRAGQQWLSVRAFCTTEAEKSSVSRMESYVNRSFAAIGPLLKRRTGSICSLIEDLYAVNIVEVREDITAILIPPDLRDRPTALSSGTPALKMHRTYLTSDGEIAQVTIDTHPASQFRHSMTIRR